MIRFNPNLYCNGKVCISVLNTWKGEQWTSCQTISTILLTLCTLLCKDPLLNEPGVSKSHNDFSNYTKIIEYKNIDIAVLKILQRKPDIYPEKFAMFYPYVKENFIKNKDALKKYVEEKSKTQQEETLKTSMYSMTVNINYKRLLAEFNTASENIA
jgi:ubiquitin-conjugating enzyme E2 Z